MSPCTPAYCTVCALPTKSLLHYLRALEFVDEAELSHALQVALARTALSQRPFAELAGCSQSTVSKHRRFPRPIEVLPPHIDLAEPPLAHDGVSVLERWCAYKAASLGWVPSFQHRIRRPRRTGTLLRWRRCDVVLSPPGEWRPEWAVEVKRTITTAAEAKEALAAARDYAGPLRCRPLVVAYELAPRLRSIDVIDPWELEQVIGSVGAPYAVLTRVPAAPRHRDDGYWS